MDKNSDLMTEEINMKKAEELEELGKNHKLRNEGDARGTEPAVHPLIFGGIGVLILIIIVALFLRGESRDSSGELNAIKARVEHLEKESIAGLERMSQKVSSFEGGIIALERSIAKLEKSEALLRSQLDETSQKVDSLKDQMAADTTKTETEVAVKEVPISKTKTRYHVVRRGDTLYGISRKYQIPVERLLRLNNFDQKQIIHPGQEILVGPND